MWKNSDQKNSEYGHFLRTVIPAQVLLSSEFWETFENNFLKIPGGYSFSTYAKFSLVLTFLTYVCVSGGKKC